METFFEMLTYRRPMDSDTEERFIEKFLGPLDVERDEVGNIWKRIGDSDVLWSSHTDTVHAIEGMQSLNITNHMVSLAEGSNSNCLGADCTTGVYIMTEMIKANKPGLYVFHRGEERGAYGSRFIAKDKTLLEGINMAIAFDRYGTKSIITHQGMGRGCSDKFGDSLSEQLQFLDLDTGGIFTDTANYMDIVPECTNLSVGYDGHHTPKERQNLTYLRFFIDQMIGLDTTKLVVARDPSEHDYGWYGGWADFYGVGDDGWDQSPKEDRMTKLIKSNPAATANLLTLYGISYNELTEHIFAFSKNL